MTQSVRIKETIAAAAAIGMTLAAAVLWRADLDILQGSDLGAYVSFLVPLALLLGAGCFFLIAATFIRTPWMGYGMAIAAVGVPYFFASFSSLTVMAGCVSAGGIVYALHRMRKEYAFQHHFSISKIAYAGLGLYFTAVSLIVSVYYVGTIDREKAIFAILPRSVFDATLTPTSDWMESFLGVPELDPTASVDDTLVTLLEEQMRSRGITDVSLPPDDLRRLLSVQRENLKRQLGVTFTGKEKIKDVLYNSAIDRLGELLGPYQRYLPLAAGITFFFALKTITYPLYYLTVFVTFLLIQLLRMGRIVKSETQTIEVERLTL